MIPVTKEEAKLLRELYPEYTVKIDVAESTNYAAANIVAQIDKERALRKKRAELQGRKYG